MLFPLRSTPLVPVHLHKPLCSIQTSYPHHNLLMLVKTMYGFGGDFRKEKSEWFI
jgi:hypothetical protein